MKKFLSEAAEKIINSKHYGAQSVVILPNRRSEVFLKEEIKKISKKSIWLPEFYPIDEFIQKTSGIEKADNITIFFDLYRIHQNMAGAEAKTIDEFLTWAPVMLSDFNDIDNSMADAKDVFTQLSAVKAMQQWNPDGSPLTQMQQNYLHFFNSMYDYYTDLRGKLFLDNIGYQGSINRNVAENTSSLLKKQHWNNFLIVGINALNEAEIRILDFINSNYQTNFIWDVDEYYFSKNKNTNNTQEAGKQIRHVIDRLKLNEPDNIGNNLTQSTKEINLLGIPKNIGQAKFIGQELQKQTGLSNLNNENSSKKMSTAVVLANEELLIPILNSLPVLHENNEKHYNLTLGYPLSNSPVEHFFNIWVDLIIFRSQNNEYIHTTNLISLLNNPLVRQLSNINESSKLTKHLIHNNISTISMGEIENKLSQSNKGSLDFLKLLFNTKKEDNVTSVLQNLKEALIAIIAKNSNINLITKEQVKLLIKIISKMIILSTDNLNIINFNAIKKIGRQLISLTTLNLIGEPLHGIQIMGMLETRNLDFENIYILSTNEGIIPKKSTINSFIPMDIRSQRKLPLPSDKSDIYAYHFYRLMQRAKNITLLYNSDSGKMGGGEKSRFILQIENELSKINSSIKINNKIINTTLTDGEEETQKVQNIDIIKNDSIINKINEIAINGYSPSLLGSYINCPLKFYFSHILKISTTTTLEQSIEPNTFGTVAHAVLEDIYKPMKGKEIEVEILKKYLPKTHELLSKQFKKHYSNGKLNSGKNLLIFEVAHTYIKSFLKWDINYLTHNPTKLHSTEAKLITSISQDLSIINFKGIIDRIDTKKNDNTVRIIDYKTGRVDTKDLYVKNIEEITTDPKYAKAFQVVFYAWLYHRNNPNSKIETGIISLRNISNGFIPLKIHNLENIQDYFDEFTSLIVNIIKEISDINIPFLQTDDEARCTWCDYKSICNK